MLRMDGSNSISSTSPIVVTIDLRTRFHKNQLREAKFTDGHQHYHRVGEPRACAQCGRRLALTSRLLTVTESYARSYCVFMGENGEVLFVGEENDTDFMPWKPQKLLRHF